MSMPQAAVALLGLALLASPATAQDADLALPPVPEVTVSVEPPAGRAPAAAAVTTASPAAASLDLVLPQPPEAPVTITVADRLPALLAARLADGSAQLLPRLGKKEREAEKGNGRLRHAHRLESSITRHGHASGALWREP